MTDARTTSGASPAAPVLRLPTRQRAASSRLSCGPDYDGLAVSAGFAGSVPAELLARQRGEASIPRGAHSHPALGHDWANLWA